MLEREPFGKKTTSSLRAKPNNLEGLSRLISPEITFADLKKQAGLLCLILSQKRKKKGLGGQSIVKNLVNLLHQYQDFLAQNPEKGSTIEHSAALTSLEALPQMGFISPNLILQILDNIFELKEEVEQARLKSEQKRAEHNGQAQNSILPKLDREPEKPAYQKQDLLDYILMHLDMGGDGEEPNFNALKGRLDKMIAAKIAEHGEASVVLVLTKDIFLGWLMIFRFAVEKLLQYKGDNETESERLMNECKHLFKNVYVTRLPKGIRNFTDNDAQVMLQAVREFQEAGSTEIILDATGNPQAVEENFEKLKNIIGGKLRQLPLF